jgi:hypothetical protein
MLIFAAAVALAILASVRSIMNELQLVASKSVADATRTGDTLAAPSPLRSDETGMALRSMTRRTSATGPIRGTASVSLIDSPRGGE